MTHIVKRIGCLALCALMFLAPALADEGAPEGVLAVINGTSYSAADAQAEFTYYARMYEAYGMSDDIEALKNDLIDYYVQVYVQLDAAHQLGLDEFTDDELAAFSEEAQAEYDAMLSDYIQSFQEEGVSEEDIRAQVLAFFEENNYTPERACQSLRDSRVMERYYDYVTADAQVSDEALKESYDELVAQQRSEYDEDPWYFEYDAIYGGDIYYVPEGFRTVFHILLLPDDEGADRLAELQAQKSELENEIASPAKDADLEALARELEDVEAQITEVCRPLLEKADEIYARLEEGEDFKTLMDEYGQDPGMQTEPTRSKGYYVREDSEMWEPNFRDGAMALEKEGDVSEPVVTSYGVHLILHGGELAAGPVPMEQVIEGLRQEALSQAEQAAYDDAVAAAVEAADIVLYPENVTYEPAEPVEAPDGADAAEAVG